MSGGEGGVGGRLWIRELGLRGREELMLGDLCCVVWLLLLLLLHMMLSEGSRIVIGGGGGHDLGEER